VSNVGTRISIRTYKFRIANKTLPPLPIFVSRNPWQPLAVTWGFAEPSMRNTARVQRNFLYILTSADGTAPQMWEFRKSRPLPYKNAVTNKKGNTDTASTMAAPFHLASIYFHDNCQIYIWDINVIFTTFSTNYISFWQIFGEFNSRST
jgi:hypothetical protein